MEGCLEDTRVRCRCDNLITYTCKHHQAEIERLERLLRAANKKKKMENEAKAANEDEASDSAARLMLAKDRRCEVKRGPRKLFACPHTYCAYTFTYVCIHSHT